MRLPAGQPFLPEVGTVYWVETSLLPPGDPEDQRAVVVLEAPATVDGTVVVVARVGDEGFSRRVPVQCRAWTSSDVTPAGRLDAAGLASLRDRFAW